MYYKVLFRTEFLKRARKLDKSLFDKLFEKTELLRNRSNHSDLRVHKLHGKLSKYYSFSIDYNLRVVFWFKSDNEIVLVDLGNHDIYR